MRTLATQVRLRRLIRTFAEVVDRLLAEPSERLLATSSVSRLQGLAEGVREAWDGEAAAGRPEDALAGYVEQALRTAELAIAGLGQAGRPGAAPVRLRGGGAAAGSLPEGPGRRAGAPALRLNVSLCTKAGFRAGIQCFCAQNDATAPLADRA